MTRNEVISTAITQCLKDLYSHACPAVTWEKFKEENELYNKLYKEWNEYNAARNARDLCPEVWKNYRDKYEVLDWENKSFEECVGPKPFEFYYIPIEILNDICNSYIHAYRFDQAQELLDTIEILKNYCKKPIDDRHIDNLETQLFDLIPDSGFDKSEVVTAVQDKFFEFLDMAGNFYKWNTELNGFKFNIYLGACPSSNKQGVIDHWKKYRNQNIEIDEEQMKKNFYGDDE